MKTSSLCLAFVCASLMAGPRAWAQDSVDPSETARFRWGPVRFTPTVEITNFGRDSNVYNEADNPKSDFLAAVGPAVDMWIRPFGSRLTVRTGGQYLYFKKYDDQRAWNTNNEVRWEVPMARVTPFVAGTYLNSRERQGFEIDSRSRRRDRSVTLGTSLRVSAKTAFVVSFRRFDAEYDDQETFLGSTLASELNRREDSTKVQLRYAMTPLTTFVVDTELGRDRFEVASIRDSDSIKVMPGFELKPAALISGSVFVGFRRFNPLTTSLPDYSGVVAAVKARYIRSSTRYDLVVDRDVAYSFEATQPYYALLNSGLTVTQRVTRRWDVVGRGSLQRLAYRDLDLLAAPTGAGSAAGVNRVDSGREYGGGVGFRLSDVVRLGLNVSRATRRSSVVGRRDYEGTRIFGSVTYGIQQ
jgi:hypothetical protein